ncbi:MAG TPA: S8 family serine peptidase, partial [Solirubrobacteraceae bacterium]
MSAQLVTLRSREDARTVAEAGCTVLATYPDALLASCTDEQRDELLAAGLEAVEIEYQPVEAPGASFTLESAGTADQLAPLAKAPGRTAYYLVGMAGPAHGSWLAELEALGGSVHGTLPGFTLVVGIAPERESELVSLPWVRGIASYRPLMKVHPDLRVGRRAVEHAELGEPTGALEPSDATAQVEIAVFAGELIAPLRGFVEEHGGTVLTAGEHELVALVPNQAVPAIAEQPGIAAVQPHQFPRLFNNVATGIMGVPGDRKISGTALSGTKQIVAIADGGLDTGDAKTVHADLMGRVNAIVSFPIDQAWRGMSTNAAPFDDGPADKNEGHGTHVAGSVAGDGSAARSAGAP